MNICLLRMWHTDMVANSERQRLYNNQIGMHLMGMHLKATNNMSTKCEKHIYYNYMCSAHLAHASFALTGTHMWKVRT